MSANMPVPDHVLSKEVARLVLIFRLEGVDWKIVHSGISIPYHLVQDGEVYPMKALREQNKALEARVSDRAQSEEQARLVAEKICTKLSEPYRIPVVREGVTDKVVQHRCSVSIGVRVFIGTDAEPNDVLMAADAAMYRAKDAGRNSVWVDGATD